MICPVTLHHSAQPAQSVMTVSVPDISLKFVCSLLSLSYESREFFIHDYEKQLFSFQLILQVIPIRDDFFLTVVAGL